MITLLAAANVEAGMGIPSTVPTAEEPASSGVMAVSQSVL
jgi:hypothetical protein